MGETEQFFFSQIHFNTVPLLCNSVFPCFFWSWYLYNCQCLIRTLCSSFVPVIQRELSQCTGLPQLMSNRHSSFPLGKVSELVQHRLSFSPCHSCLLLPDLHLNPAVFRILWQAMETILSLASLVKEYFGDNTFTKLENGGKKGWNVLKTCLTEVFRMCTDKM